jgi:hypothetical protein
LTPRLNRRKQESAARDRLFGAPGARGHRGEAALRQENQNHPRRRRFVEVTTLALSPFLHFKRQTKQNGSVKRERKAGSG